MSVAAVDPEADPGGVVQCGCCHTAYDNDNDIVLFGLLSDCNGRRWALCGPCIQVMWRERAPKPEPEPAGM